MSDANIGCCGGLTSCCKSKAAKGCDNTTCKNIDPTDEPYQKQEGELTFVGPDPSKKTVMKVTVLSYSSPTQNRNVVDVKMRDSQGALVSPQKVALAQGRRDAAAARQCQSAPVGSGRPAHATSRGANGAGRCPRSDGHGGPGCSKLGAQRGSPTRVGNGKHRGGGAKGAAKGSACRCVRRDSGVGTVRCACKVASCPAQKDSRRSAIKAAVAARADGLEAAECGCARSPMVAPCECTKDDCPAKKSRAKEAIRLAVAARADGFPASECGCPDPADTAPKTPKVMLPPPTPAQGDADADAESRGHREKDVEDAVLYEKVTAYQTGDTFSLETAASGASERQNNGGEDETLPFSNVYNVTYRVRTKPDSAPFRPNPTAVGAQPQDAACPCGVADDARCACNKQVRAQVAKCSCGNKYLRVDKKGCACRLRGRVDAHDPCAAAAQQDKAAQGEDGKQKGGLGEVPADGVPAGNACELARLARARAAREEKKRRKEAKRTDGAKKPEVEAEPSAKTDGAQVVAKSGDGELGKGTATKDTAPPPAAATPASKKDSKKESKKDGHTHKSKKSGETKTAHYASLEVPTTLPGASSERVTRLTDLDGQASAYSLKLDSDSCVFGQARRDSVIDVAAAESQLQAIADRLRDEVAASLRSQAALVSDLRDKFSELTGQVARQTDDLRTMLGDCLAKMVQRSAEREVDSDLHGADSRASFRGRTRGAERHLQARRARSSTDNVLSRASRSRSRSRSDLSVSESEESLDLRRRSAAVRPRRSIIRGSSTSSATSLRSTASNFSASFSEPSTGDVGSDESRRERRGFGSVRRSTSRCN